MRRRSRRLERRYVGIHIARTFSRPCLSRKADTRAAELGKRQGGPVTRPLRCHQTRSTVQRLYDLPQPTLRLAFTVASRRSCDVASILIQGNDLWFLGHSKTSYATFDDRMRILFVVYAIVKPLAPGLPWLSLKYATRLLPSSEIVSGQIM